MSISLKHIYKAFAALMSVYLCYHLNQLISYIPMYGAEPLDLGNP